MAFPAYADFSIDLITEPVRIIKGGTVREELPLLAKVAHTGAGVALKLTVGEPGEGPFAAVATADVTDEQIEEYGDAIERLEGTAMADDGPEKLDPATIALILQVMKLVYDLIKKRRENK